MGCFIKFSVLQICLWENIYPKKNIMTILYTEVYHNAHTNGN